jgi:hypothetical protein
VKKCALMLLVLFSLALLALGCKPKETPGDPVPTPQRSTSVAPDSGAIGGTALSVKGQAVKAVDKAQKQRSAQDELAAGNE